MQIWIDGDACPVVIKEILFRAATRTKTNVILVANQYIRVPKSPFIKTLQVESGFLNMRDFLDTMRSSGVDTGGPPAFSQSDRKAFADNLDNILSKQA